MSNGVSVNVCEVGQSGGGGGIGREVAFFFSFFPSRLDLTIVGQVCLPPGSMARSDRGWIWSREGQTWPLAAGKFFFFSENNRSGPSEGHPCNRTAQIKPGEEFFFCLGHTLTPLYMCVWMNIHIPYIGACVNEYTKMPGTLLQTREFITNEEKLNYFRWQTSMYSSFPLKVSKQLLGEINLQLAYFTSKSGFWQVFVPSFARLRMLIVDDGRVWHCLYVLKLTRLSP